MGYSAGIVFQESGIQACEASVEMLSDSRALKDVHVFHAEP
jgi:hypothetical protein